MSARVEVVTSRTVLEPTALKLVSINGSPRQPSRTEALVTTLADAIAVRTGARRLHIALSEQAAHILSALTADRLSVDGRSIIDAVETADILVVGTPVYRGSFTGILKHLFDLTRFDALKGRISVLAASGGTPLHGLATEHQLRPLLSFFGTHTVPTAIYALESDFIDHQLTNPLIRERINLAADEAARLLSLRSSLPTLQSQPS